MKIDRKKIVLLTTTIVLALTIGISYFFSSFSSTLGLAAMHERQKSLPTVAPAAISGWTFTGTYLRIGINDAGSFIDPRTNVGWEYPIGAPNECLAVAWLGEGYVIAYKVWKNATWVDNVAYFQPSYGLVNLKQYWKVLMRNDANFAVVRIIMQTTDNQLRLVFEFRFPKDQKYVELRTGINNIGSGSVRDVLYKRIVDWDIHRTISNHWTSDSHAAYASYYNETTACWYFMTVSGENVWAPRKYVSYADLYAWDDDSARIPSLSIQSDERIWFDGCAGIYYDFEGEWARGWIGNVFTVYQAAENPYIPPPA